MAGGHPALQRYNKRMNCLSSYSEHTLYREHTSVHFNIRSMDSFVRQNSTTLEVDGDGKELLSGQIGSISPFPSAKMGMHTKIAYLEF